jgi:hypothetical protein
MRAGTQLSAHNVLSRLALIYVYDCEMLALISQDKKPIKTLQMKFMSLVLGVTLKNKLRDEDIGERLET